MTKARHLNIMLHIALLTRLYFTNVREIHLFIHALLVGKRSVPVIIIVKKRGSDIFDVLVNVNVEFASAL